MSDGLNGDLSQYCRVQLEQAVIEHFQRRGTCYPEKIVTSADACH